MSEFIPWLLQNGWSKSERSLELISPSGERYGLDRIMDLEPAFQQAKKFNREAEALAYPAQRYGSPGSGNYAPGVSKPKPEFPGRKWTPYEKLKMRLNLAIGDTFGMDYCNIHEGPNTTFVFLVKGDKSIVLEDSTLLFPSDSLIGRFRMFQQAVE